jgi:hypothetical protein
MNTAQIKDMIDQLGMTENGEKLKSAMDRLKIALLENPDAVALMAPEDIGEAVRNLRRLTGQLIANESVNKKTGSTTKIKVTKELIDSVEDDLFDGK